VIQNAIKLGTIQLELSNKKEYHPHHVKHSQYQQSVGDKITYSGPQNGGCDLKKWMNKILQQLVTNGNYEIL
jgi:hypothetical protein